MFLGFLIFPYLTEGQDGSPAPAVHHEDAEDVAGNLDEDAQEEVGVGITRETGGGEREAVVAHRHTEPLDKKTLSQLEFLLLAPKEAQEGPISMGMSVCQAQFLIFISYQSIFHT